MSQIPTTRPRLLWTHLAVVATFLVTAGTALRLLAGQELLKALDALGPNLPWAGVAGLLAAGSLGYVLAHRLAQPLQSLTLASLELRTPDEEISLPEFETDAETEQLAGTLRWLAEELHRTRAELRSERDRLDRVVSSMHEGVLLLDQDGKVQLVNDALRQMLLLGPRIAGASVSEALADQQLTELLEAALRGENSSQELELKGPPPKQVLANVRRLHKRRGALAVLVDITERRRLETVRQEFVANASHELRTPIAAILSAVETLQGPAVMAEAVRVNFIEMIDRNAKRLRQLVDDLLEVSQLESGRFRLDLEVVNLRQQAEATLAGQLPAARRKKTKIVCLVPSDYAVLGNPRGIDHVIGNLVQNAINYCPEGSEVIVEAQSHGEHVELRVKDNGPGIAPEHCDRLFERFYRVDTGRSRNVGGTGLGLSIVKHWTDAMQGSVHLDSKLGKGTVFTVTLKTSPGA